MKIALIAHDKKKDRLVHHAGASFLFLSLFIALLPCGWVFFEQRGPFAVR